MITYQETKRGWDAAAASAERRSYIHPSAVGGPFEYFASGASDARNIVNIICGVLQLKLGHIASFFKDRSIIEFGCGDGRVLKEMQCFFKKCYGVDYSYSMLQNIVDIHNIERVLSVDNMFLIKDLADFAYSIHVFIHNNYESGKQIMKSISDNLKPGGLALLQIPIYDVAREPESWTGVGVWTEQMLIDTAKESGFEILELNKNSGSFSYEQPGPNHFKYQIMRKTAE